MCPRSAVSTWSHLLFQGVFRNSNAVCYHRVYPILDSSQCVGIGLEVRHTFQSYIWLASHNATHVIDQY